MKLVLALALLVPSMAFAEGKARYSFNQPTMEWVCTSHAGHIAERFGLTLKDGEMKDADGKVNGSVSYSGGVCHISVN